MRINVFLTHNNIDELYFNGLTVAVIDVLRATTTITAALNNGAKEVIPVSSIEFAMKLSGSHTLLGGERHTKKIEGFSLGNSPCEYTEDIVKNKSIIIYTTNGSKAIVKAKFAKTVICCSFPNLEISAKYLLSLGTDIEIVCSGNNGMFSIEDTVCAGMLINEISKLSGEITLNDGGNAAFILAKQYSKKVLKMLQECDHGKVLAENGFGDDLKYAAKLNSIDVIPVFDSSSLKLLPSSVIEKLRL
jgi:2-phosphosulfolactate phosphatase